MKTTLLLALALLSGLQFSAQGCSEIFISEYIEGWSNNKAIELYNPTENPIDLSAYRLERYSNGSTSAADNQKLDLEGTIQPESTWVIVIDKQDPDGTGQEAPVWQELADAADIFMCPVYDDNNAMYFNGNDAIVLRLIDGNVVLDVVGKIGEDPGNPSDGGGWNNVGPDFTWAANGETAWSANHTLVRKFDVTIGDVDPVDAFDVGLEYDSLPANTFDNLGWHDCACAPISVNELQKLTVSVFPNPSDDGHFLLTSALKAERVEVYSATAQLLETLTIGQPNGALELDLSHLGTGMFFIQLSDERGIRATTQVLVH